MDFYSLILPGMSTSQKTCNRRRQRCKEQKLQYSQEHASQRMLVELRLSSYSLCREFNYYYNNLKMIRRAVRNLRSLFTI